jgi:hypothetical protein
MILISRSMLLAAGLLAFPLASTVAHAVEARLSRNLPVSGYLTACRHPGKSRHAICSAMNALEMANFHVRHASRGSAKLSRQMSI